MYLYTLPEALLICYKQSPDNARSVALSLRANIPRLVEDETFNDSDIINNLIDYEDGQEEPNSCGQLKYMQGYSFPKKVEKHFLKIDTNSERSVEFQKEL
ncbi:UNVERIFIED_CONTAM: hypothetical protein NCL1_21395 [Trichonephila clavipes]